jgi:hypothetical protein
MIEVARKLHRSCNDEIEPEFGTLLKIFEGIHSETDALPVGNERALWNAEALVRQDEKIAEAERRWHDRALGAATELIRLLEQGW